MKHSWEDFDHFEENTKDLLPSIGEGSFMAEQLVTAVTKLIYKWFNDGDVPDNKHALDGWCNNLSSYANWLEKYIPEAKGFFEKFCECYSEQEYTEVLYWLAETLFAEDVLNSYKEVLREGTIYNCSGSFEWSDEEDEEEEY